MTRVSEKTWNSILPQIRSSIREGTIPSQVAENPDFRPTHIIDIYKMRRGRYKNVRIWTHLHLGTGRRLDLFMTTADNEPINRTFDLFSSAHEEMIQNWREIFKEGVEQNID